jgi:hypothetical protein
MRLSVWLQNTFYWIKSPVWYATRRIKILARWIKFGWNSYDFDYRYSVDAFILQLNATADFMESKRAMSVGSSKSAAEIREVANELRRVYDDEYALAYFDRLNEKWGDTGFKFVPTGEKILNPISGKTEGTSTMERTFERPMTPSDIAAYEADYEQWRAEADVVQAHHEAAVWEVIRGRIRHWWD